ncbi:MAG TPA: 16S rRNA (adenine(1518)-N(6)/adenine(1519)-N(6))-dimethyltransferase RsmA [Anaerolineales bacterium]
MKLNTNSTTSDVPGLLRRFGLRPDKRLGQNFLIEESELRKIIDIAQIGSSDTVLEIGPGLGSLTRLLAEQSQRVVAVELDEKLIPPLKEVLSPFPNVQLVQGDILALNLDHLLGEISYRVVANIPYYITSALIRHLLEAKAKPYQMVLTVQREVAERITAKPGDMSLLALSVQVYGAPEVMARIPAEAFYPAPAVDSAVVRVNLYPEPIMPTGRLSFFFRLAKAGFSQKRKTLRNSLSGGMHWSPPQAEAVLRSAGIDPQRRAETLSLEEWGKLVEVAE